MDEALLRAMHTDYSMDVEHLFFGNPGNVIMGLYLFDIDMTGLILNSSDEYALIAPDNAVLIHPRRLIFC
jgi:hypothetical protein